MSTVRRAARDLLRCVDERILFDRGVGCFVEIVRRTFERIELDVLREFLAVAGRSSVVSHQHDVTRRAEQVRIPAQAKVVGPHVGGAAVDEDEQRILLRRVEVGRQRHETVNLLAATVGEPEFAQRLPVDLRDAIVGEVSERRPLAGGEVDAPNLSRMNRALPVRYYYSIGRPTNTEPAVRSSFQSADFTRLAAVRRHAVQLNESLVLGGEENRLAVGTDLEI